jgi:hypothetical protein
MPDSTHDISRALRDRLADNESWRGKRGKPPRRWKPAAVDFELVPAKPIAHRRVLLGVLLLALICSVVVVLAITTSPSTHASQVPASPTRIAVPTTALPELWLTPAVPRPMPE